MTRKCIKISSWACFFIIFVVVLCFLPLIGKSEIPFGYQRETLTFSNGEVECDLDDMSDVSTLKTPSLESFIRASQAVEGNELRLSGLAVFSKLANACQPLADVSKAKIQVNKIALIRLARRTVCPLLDLAVHAQNAGYSVVIFFDDCKGPFSSDYGKQTQTQDKLLIPVLCPMSCYLANYSSEIKTISGNDIDLSAEDRSNIEISAAMRQTTDDLDKMQQYLRRLYCWFILCPVITLALEWLRRTKKLSMSTCQQVEESRASEETAGELELNTVADYVETQRNYNQETDKQNGGETQPLLTVLNDPYTTVTTTGYTRSIANRRVIIYLGKIFGKLAVGCRYVILIVVALPVGISSGGWSFFRFDENESREKSFWDDLSDIVFDETDETRNWIHSRFLSFLPLWWSPLQIVCFFLYSWIACETTWTVQTDFSKLIRSDWFASNMSLFILGVVVPYCTSSDFDSLDLFIYFTSYNMVCTICNVLFVIILNKHKFVTRYVLYISVCMICAYIESDIVALFYFMLNSKGSLTNLNLSALRTVAISLTLTVSFSSSMHIIRKLTRPQESLSEGLGEK